MALPPLAGADQLTVAEALPAVAVTPLGAAGAVGGPAVPGLNTSVPSSQIVLAPAPTAALGLAPAATTWSSVSRSMLPLGQTLPRTVQPLPAVSGWLKPESP